jgi:hypothetical protein
MTSRDELIALANEAGAELYADTICVNGKDADDFVTRFAALVAAKEREACAKVCDALHQSHVETYGNYFEETYASECAATIRARKP